MYVYMFMNLVLVPVCLGLNPDSVFKDLSWHLTRVLCMKVKHLISSTISQFLVINNKYKIDT